MAESEHQARLVRAAEAYLQSRRDLASEILIARSEGRTYGEIAARLGFTAPAVRQLVRASPVVDDERAGT
jgi:DNA-directed RNA polymerase specialized sigma24 family protein